MVTVSVFIICNSFTQQKTHNILFMNTMQLITLKYMTFIHDKTYYYTQ